MMKKITNSLVIPTFVSKVQLFAFFMSREKAIRMAGKRQLGWQGGTGWHRGTFCYLQAGNCYLHREGIVMAIAYMPVVVTCYLQ